MHRCLILLLLPLAGCGVSNEPAFYVPADLLRPEPGWTGPVPTNVGQLVDAAAAEKRGRETANAKLLTIAEMLHQPDT